MKRILHVFGKMDCGGAETRTMEIYRNIDHNKIQFDFLTMKDGKGYYDNEINMLGGNIYIISSPAKVSILRHIKEIISIMKYKGPFHAVHAHTAYHAGIISLAAYIAGIKIRIVHSRSASDSRTKGLRRKIYFLIMRILMNIFSTNKVACGEEAGYFLYGKKNVESGKVEIIKNAIDIELYKDLTFRNIKLREELNISETTIVIGQVGSFLPVKNHKFTVEILKRLEESQLDYVMIFVGDGLMREEIEEQIINLGLDGKTIFLGIRSDIPELMSMFDILLLPSLYEGIPGVVIEAQAAGTPCIISDTVTREVDAGLDLLEFLSIASIAEWDRSIRNRSMKKQINNEEIFKSLNDNEFSVGSSIKKLYTIYGIDGIEC